MWHAIRNIVVMTSTYDPQHTNGESLPIWYAENPPEDGAGTIVTRHYDVVVVGAGMAGLSVAYHVLRSGRSVLVVERGAIGGGETGRTSGHLASALDDRFHLLERMHGLEGARLAAESHRAAIADIFAIAQREHIACDAVHVDGYLFAARGDGRERFELDLEYAAARRAGLTVEMVERAPLPFGTGRALRFRDQAQFEPMAYLLGLAAAVRRAGGVIATGVGVDHIDDAQPAVLHLHEQGTITADQVVVATNTPINDLFAIHAKQAAYRSYVVGFEIPVGSVERALYWDMADPYHYVRLAEDNVLIVGGEDHKVGQTQDPEQAWTRLADWTRTHFPMVGEKRFQWSGQILEPADGVAFIGRNPGRAQNVFVVTGDSGNGLTHGAIAGMLLADLIAGRDNPWAKLYEPARKMTHPTALREMVRENANVALRYADWVKPSQGSQIEPGHGAVIRRGIHKVAVHVDEAGKRHECAARCPHLGGVVQWNRAERSWDCPLHGSRFDPHGKVMTGPATDDLAHEPGERRSEESLPTVHAE